MRTFDFYEFVAVLVPGTVLLTSIGLIHPRAMEFLNPSDISLGEVGVFLILAYATGHLIQAVGNIIEDVWWDLWGGMPTDWIRTRKHSLMSSQQVEAVDTKLKNVPGLAGIERLASLSKREWVPITRQMYVAVQSQGNVARVDTFEGNYGLFRGIAAAGISVLVRVLVDSGFNAWKAELGLVAGTVAAIYRMHRFGKHYARELFAQFLQLPLHVGSGGTHKQVSLNEANEEKKK